MFLAALADLGVDLKPLESLLAKAGIEACIEAVQSSRCGLSGRSLDLQWPEQQPLRHLPTILDIIEGMELSTNVQTRSREAFTRLAEVEASVHGLPLNQVHFHEVGAVDTLVDIVGCFWALEQLGVESVSCSHLPWFQGFVDSSHGRLPLPAPATARLLQGKPVYPTSFQEELITPTGALLVDSLVEDFQTGPSGRLQAEGIGWGRKDLGQVPNGLRLFLLQPSSQEQIERIWILECNIDHMTGEEIGDLFEVLQEAGALDVLYIPGVMKKNRPGGLIQVLCRPKELDSLQQSLFKHSLSLGVRRRESERVVLPRRQQRLQTPMGAVQAKAVELEGTTWSRPEFEALKQLADKTGRSVVQLRYLLSPGKAGED
jgi:hypothetical protein